MEETWILGNAFLRGFYSTHDHKEKRFGFAPHSLSTKKGARRGQQPSEELPIVLGVIDYVIIGIAAAVVVTGIILLLVHFTQCCIPNGSFPAKVEFL